MALSDAKLCQILNFEVAILNTCCTHRQVGVLVPFKASFQSFEHPPAFPSGRQVMRHMINEESADGGDIRGRALSNESWK